jgi:hypothetical protein
LEDDQHSEQPVEFDEDALSALVEAEPYLSAEELATKLNSTSSTVHWHLNVLGKFSKLRKWMPHEFNSNEFVTMHKHLPIFHWPPRTGVLLHPPYSPDLAPSDYHLFRGLQNYLDCKKFANTEDLRNAVITFITSKPIEFFK